MHVALPVRPLWAMAFVDFGFVVPPKRPDVPAQKSCWFAFEMSSNKEFSLSSDVAHQTKTHIVFGSLTPTFGVVGFGIAEFRTTPSTMVQKQSAVSPFSKAVRTTLVAKRRFCHVRQSMSLCSRRQSDGTCKILSTLPTDNAAFGAPMDAWIHVFSLQYVRLSVSAPNASAVSPRHQRVNAFVPTPAQARRPKVLCLFSQRAFDHHLRLRRVMVQRGICQTFLRMSHGRRATSTH